MKIEALRLQLVDWLVAKIQSQSGLDPEMKVYRIVDFFAAAQILEQRRLWLTQVSKYDDANEGIDRFLVALYIANRGVGSWGVSDELSAQRFVELERACRYVSCWSKTPESHAMWAMYSPDKAGVKLQTSVGKLHRASAEAMAEDWIAAYSVRDPSKTHRSRVTACDVISANYVDVFGLTKRLSRRARLIQRLVAPPSTLGRKRLPNRKFNWASLLSDFRRKIFFKHEAYWYEDEVRICLKIGWEPAMSAVGEVGAFYEFFRRGVAGAEDELDALFSIGETVGLSDVADSRPFCTVPAVAGFIESVTIDPRCPAHKRAFMQHFFAKHSVCMIDSHAFGMAYKSLAGYPDLA